MDPEEVTSSIATSGIGNGSTGIPAISDEDSDTDEEFVTDALLICLMITRLRLQSFAGPLG